MHICMLSKQDHPFGIRLSFFLLFHFSIIPPSDFYIFDPTAMSESESGLPLILLDIDGVINTDGKHSENYFSDLKKVANIRKFTYSPTVISKINEWSSVAEIRWLTDWNERANTIVAPAVGLELFSLGRNEARNLTKLEAFVDNSQKNPDRLIIWIDDELMQFKQSNDRSKDTYYNEYLRYHKNIFTRPNTLLISPAIGLTADFIQVIDHVLQHPDSVSGQCVHHFEEGERLFVNRK